jgi:hypothetical protein
LAATKLQGRTDEKRRETSVVPLWASSLVVEARPVAESSSELEAGRMMDGRLLGIDWTEGVGMTEEVPVEAALDESSTDEEEGRLEEEVDSAVGTRS